MKNKPDTEKWNDHYIMHTYVLSTALSTVASILWFKNICRGFRVRTSGKKLSVFTVCAKVVRARVCNVLWMARRPVCLWYMSFVPYHFNMAVYLLAPCFPHYPFSFAKRRRIIRTTFAEVLEIKSVTMRVPTALCMAAACALLSGVDG